MERVKNKEACLAYNGHDGIDKSVWENTWLAGKLDHHCHVVLL